MSLRGILSAALLVSLLGEGMPAQDQGGVVAVRCGRILTMTQGPVENGVVLIRGGKIEAVGRDLPIPDGAAIIDAGDGFCMPGLVDAGTARGLDRGERENEEGLEVTPEIRVADALHARAGGLSALVQNGVTTAFAAPGVQNVVGGLGVVFKPVDRSGSVAVLREDAALRVTLGPEPSRGNRPPMGEATSLFSRRPTTRMGVIWALRSALHAARERAGPRGGAAPTEARSVLLRALEGDLQVRIRCYREAEMRAIFNLMDRPEDRFEDLQVVLDRAPDAHRLADELARRGISVVLGPVAHAPEGRRSAGFDPSDVVVPTPATARILVERGVRIAFQSAGSATPDEVLVHAREAVRFGLSPEEALRALTVSAAGILGVADRVGSLEPGRDADLVVFSGDPLLPTSRVRLVMIDGTVVFEENGGRPTP